MNFAKSFFLAAALLPLVASAAPKPDAKGNPECPVIQGHFLKDNTALDFETLARSGKTLYRMNKIILIADGQLRSISIGGEAGTGRASCAKGILSVELTMKAQDPEAKDERHTMNIEMLGNDFLDVTSDDARFSGAYSLQKERPHEPMK